MIKLANGLSFDPEKIVTAHRKPTGAEIRRGYGATHYADFPIMDFYDPKTNRLKRRIKGVDGLIYSRG